MIFFETNMLLHNMKKENNIQSWYDKQEYILDRIILSHTLTLMIRIYNPYDIVIFSNASFKQWNENCKLGLMYLWYGRFFNKNLKGHRHDWWCLFTISFFLKLKYISSMKSSQNRTIIFKLIVHGIELHGTYKERENKQRNAKF